MKWLFLIFLFLGFTCVTAQVIENPYFDSLLTVLSKAKEDTIKVKMMNYIANVYLFTNNEKGIKYAKESEALSKKLSWDIGLMFSKINIGRYYWLKGNFKMAVLIHNEALQIAKRLKRTEEINSINILIGQDYGDGSEYDEALKYFEIAKFGYEEAGNKGEVARCLLLISWVHDTRGNYPESSKANIEALKIYESIGEDYGTAIASVNLAQDNIKLEKYPEAISYIARANDIYIKESDFINLSFNFILLSDIYIKLRNFDSALNNAERALDAGEKVNDAIAISNAYSKMADINYMQNDFRKAAQQYENAIAFLKPINAYVYLSNNYGSLALSNLRLNETTKAKSALDSAEIYLKLNETLPSQEIYYKGKHLLDSMTGDWKNAYSDFFKFISIRDSIYNKDNTKKLVQTQMQYEFDKKESLKKAEQEKKDIKQRNIRNSIATAFAGAIVFLVVVYRQRNKISRARRRSDELLLNILPGEVADELKIKGSADAKQFDQVTVMFTDFKGFTKISENLTPTELVQEIHTCFRAFDDIIGRFSIEKIKTIGDSYMCAGGLPLPNQTHAEDVVNAALEIQRFMRQHSEERKNSGKEIFEIRIGIHMGPVVAGIVGVKKFAYDIWGDTVNIASRMESSGEAGKVNISGATYEKVKDKFTCIHRGKISAKNKGEVDMYFVEGLLPHKF